MLAETGPSKLFLDTASDSPCSCRHGKFCKACHSFGHLFEPSSFLGYMVDLQMIDEQQELSTMNKHLGERSFEILGSKSNLPSQDSHLFKTDHLLRVR